MRFIRNWRILLILAIFTVMCLALSATGNLVTPACVAFMLGMMYSRYE